MAVRKGVGSSDEDVLRTMSSWQADAKKQHGVGVRVLITPTTRTGVWVIRAQALEMADEKPVAVRVQIRQEYPTAQHQTFLGALMNALMQLDHELGYDGLHEPETPV